MQGRRPQLLDGQAVPGGAVAGVALQAIARIAPGKPADQGVPGHLGDHAGGGDGGAMAVSPHQAALGPQPTAQRQDPIHQNQRRFRPKGPTEALQGPQHGPFGGQPNAVAINLGRRSLAEGPTCSPLVNQGHEQLPAPGRQGLAIGEAGGNQGAGGPRGKHHRRRKHRTKPAAPPHLIHPGRAAGIGIQARRWLGSSAP